MHYNILKENIKFIKKIYKKFYKLNIYFNCHLINKYFNTYNK